MPYLPSLSEGSLFDILVRYPQFSEPLHIFLQNLLRGEGPFSEDEREMIAGYVSGLNECGFCCNTHTGVAEQLGTGQGLVGDLLDDIETAGIADNMRPVIAYVKKLTQRPASVAQCDVDAILNAGWKEDAVVYANLICGAFSLFNRWVEGLGVDANEKYVQATIKQLMKGGYTGVNDMVERILADQTETPG